MDTRTGRSGELFATNDPIIEELLNDPNYDIRSDGTVWTQICTTGKLSVAGVWREAGRNAPKHKGTPAYRIMKYQGKALQVHRVIYRKFVGALEIDLVVNHKNANRLDNRPENLELVTQSENNIWRFREMGRPAVRGNAKLTEEYARLLRADYRLGMTYRQLMEKYKLKSKGTINAILTHQTWPDPLDPFYLEDLEIRHRKIDGKVADKIRAERRMGVSVLGLIHKYGLQNTAIRDILAYRTWKTDQEPITEPAAFSLAK